MAQNFFALDSDIVEADLGFPEGWGGTGEETLQPSVLHKGGAGYEDTGLVGSEGIPASFAQGAESCLIRCGIRVGSA